MNCDYALWSLAERVCPECGYPFKPSEFSFVPNSVKYQCPHCMQAYYGTGPRGELIPPAFQCVSCDEPIATDQMILIPADGVPESRTAARVAWLERSRIGFFSAWFKTVGMSMVNPGQLMKRWPEDRMKPAFMFFIWTMLIAATLGLSGLVLIMLIPMFAGGGAAGVGGVGLVVLVMMGIFFVLPFLVVALWGLVVHLVLTVSGERKSGIARTMQALFISSGTYAMVAIPCFGPQLLMWVAAVWWIVSAILMVREAQQVSGLRASIAVLIFPVTITVLATAAYMGFVIYAIRMAPTAPAPGTAGAAATVMGPTMTRMGNALQNFVESEGRYPAHTIELIQGEYLEPTDFLTSWSTTSTLDVTVAGHTVESYLEDMTDAERDNIFTMLTTDDNSFHRLGDFVFVYEGVPLDASDPNLWIAVCIIERANDPSSTTQQPPNAFFPQFGGYAPAAICSDGSVKYIDIEILDELETQNELRATYNLSELPDLRDVISR